jgi:MYXO-CTERM domain-containing protein
VVRLLPRPRPEKTPVPRARLLFLPALFAALPANAAEYYVSPNGNDSAAGTEAAPFRTVGRGQMAASGGDTVFIRGGVYSFSGTSATVGVTFDKSGSQNDRINYFAYPGEIPIFDLFMLTPQERVTGFDVTASWIHIRGLEVRGVQQEIVGDSWGVRIRGSNNVIEQLNVHHGEAPGIFIAGSAANNLILNCDSHHNYDPLEDGGNGDGFGCHSTGENNVIRGGRGYWNSDDGYDFINAPGVCIVENSWAFNNGYVPDMKNMPAGNGAGFKSGGFGSPPVIPSSGVPRHVIRFNVAFGNRAQGFYANHHPGGLDFLNNTAFANATNYDMLVEGGTSTHVLRNNVAMSPGTAISRFTGGTNEFNTWNLASVTVSAADFVSTAEADALMPRQADGSLPVRFARLVSGSDLIDKGTDAGLPFTGSAPDLGAYEFGAMAGAGGMGMAGSGTAGNGMAGGGTAGTGAGGMGMGGTDPIGGNAGTAPAVGGAAVGGSSGATAGGATGIGGGGAAGLAMGGAAGGGGAGAAGGAGAVSGASTTGGMTATGGANATGGSGTTGGASALGGGAGGPATPDAAGCGCRVASRSGRGPALSLLSLAALAALWRRRRTRG